MVLVACLAIGSRGDVEPLLAVLEILVESSGHNCTGAGEVGKDPVRARLACRKTVWDEIVRDRSLLTCLASAGRHRCLCTVLSLLLNSLPNTQCTSL